jgi:phage/plasmid-associated DNA primase
LDENGPGGEASVAAKQRRRGEGGSRKGQSEDEKDGAEEGEEEEEEAAANSAHDAEEETSNRKSEAEEVAAADDDDDNSVKQSSTLRVFMDWPVDDRLFTYENYKALESILSVYPKAIVRVLLAAPTNAYTYKVLLEIHIIFFRRCYSMP